MVSPDGLTRAVRCETMHRIYTLPVVEFGWIAVHDARARRGPLSCIFDSQPSPGPTVALRCAVLGCSCLCTRQAGRTRWGSTIHCEITWLRAPKQSANSLWTSGRSG